MSAPGAEPRAERVLVLAPTGRDAALLSRVLARAEIPSETCADVEALGAAIEVRAGAVLIAEEALGPAAVRVLAARLAAQPRWSDVQLLVLTSHGEISRANTARVGALAAHGHVVLLERPMRVPTLVSAVHSALRARRRQYQLRDLLAELERSVDERERLYREAEAASQLKDEFLATVSHELRTPLNAMLGWTRMLRGGALAQEKHARALETIERNARAQAQLVEDLLDVSRIVSGKLRLNLAPVRAAQVVELAVETVRPTADARGLTLRVAIEPDAGTVLADADRLQQVAWNLLSNAVKFTPRGGCVETRLRRDGGYVELCVSDTGQGIPAEFLPHLFERFRQADGGTTRAHGGLGLGLSIARRLVELHGGTIAARSDGANRGATLTVRLPLASSPTRARGAAAPRASDAEMPLECLPEVEGLRVLVVDDEPDALDLMASVLDRCRIKVTTASSAAEGLAKLKSTRPDVLVSDIGMPGEDGYALIQNVRALSAHDGGRTPAIALTAYARSEDRTRALVAGYTTHIAKPVEPAEVLVVLAHVAGRFARGSG